MCKHCPSSFGKRYILLRHYRTAHPGEQPPVAERIYQCPQCSTKFSTKSLLNQHVKRQHTSEADMNSSFTSDSSESDYDGSDSEPSSPEIGGPNQPIMAKKVRVNRSVSQDDNWRTQAPGPSNAPDTPPPPKRSRKQLPQQIDWESIDPEDDTCGGLVRSLGRDYRQNSAMKARQSIYNFRFSHRARGEALIGQAIEVIGGVFRHLIRRFIRNHPNDFVQIELDSPTLDYPIRSCVRPVDHDTFDINDFLEQVSIAMDSKTKFNMKSPMFLRVIIVQLPDQHGGIGALTIPPNYKTFLEFLRAKKTCWEPGKTGSSCVLRCIAVGLQIRERGMREIRQKGFYKRPDGSNELEEMVQRIADEVGVPVNIKLTENDFQQIQAWLNREHDGLQLVIFDRAKRFADAIFKGQSTKDRINPERDTLALATAQNHCFLVKSIKSFLSKRRHCNQCFTYYQQEHSCRLVCFSCKTEGCDVKNRRAKRRQAPIKCLHCNSWFRSKRCFRQHRAWPTCDIYERCLKCSRVVDRSEVLNGKHQNECGKRKCASCKQEYHMDDRHLCNIRKIDMKKLGPRQNMRLIGIDYETLVQLQLHRAYCACAIKVCGDCIDDDPEIEQCTSHGQRHFSFYGLDAAEKLTDWLFYDKSNENAVVLAHNGSKFDAWLSLEYLLDKGKQPNVLASGSKILQMTAGRNVRVKDTCLFWQQKLSKIQKDMGLDVTYKKGWFPHRFVTKDNLEYDGPMVAEKYFITNRMDKEEKSDFRTWRSQQTRLQLRLMALMYCMQDVKILIKAAAIFRSIVLRDTGIDPFEHCLTIAHLAGLIFQSSCLQHQVGLVPAGGYTTPHVNSLLSVRYLAYIGRKRGIRIQTSLNGTEKRIAGIPVDGFCDHSENDCEIWQSAGCYFHSCQELKCPTGIKNLPDKTHPFHDMTHWENYMRTLHNRDALRQLGYHVHLVWEHEIREMLKNDRQFKEFYENPEQWNDYHDPIQPRDALYGGRCEAFSLLRELTPEEIQNGYKIKQLDVQSLYPKVMHRSQYPLGHPTVIAGNEITTPMEDLVAEDFNPGGRFYGIVQLTIEAPRGLLIPVLPYKSKIRKKLFFSSCRTCSDKNEQDASCNHNSTERSFTGSYVSIEVALALGHGYRILRIHSAWVYAESTDLLFTKYVNYAMKGKIENSKPPTDIPLEEYVAGVKERLGIQLDENNISLKPALRFVDKLKNNSLWGKFGMDDNKSDTHFVSDYMELANLLSDPDLIIKQLRFSRGQQVMVITKKKAQARTRVHKLHSPVIASFVTAHARMYMFGWMTQLGRRLLYIDTDSLAFVSIPTEEEPPTGFYLGDLENELDRNDQAVLWVSCGPKTYSMKTANNKEKIRAKGIQLYGAASDVVSTASFKALVLSQTEEIVQNYEKITDTDLRQKLKELTQVEHERSHNLCVFVPDNLITRQKPMARLKNAERFKKIRVTFDKRKICYVTENGNFRIDTVPHGY